MSPDIEINIARDFGNYPAGRDEADGPLNGEKFREKLLVPKLEEAIQKNKHLVISLDDVKSFGSSFLDEAFGGLIRSKKFKARVISDTLKITYSWPGNKRYERLIYKYLNLKKSGASD